MEITIHQKIYYSNKEVVPIQEIAESLLALEGIIRQSPSVLERLFPGTKIENIEVFIKELRSDSIWEDLVIKFIFGSQNKFDFFITSLRERVGMDNLVNNPSLFSSILVVMLLTGGAYYVGKDKSATPEQKATIEANNNTIISIGANMLEIDPQAFRALIEEAIKDKDKLAKNAVRIVKPAKLDPEADITFSEKTELRIDADTVKAMPRFVLEPEPEEFIEDYKAIDLEVRATDLDSSKRGWAVVVPDFGNKRVRLQLDPTVDPEEALRLRYFSGNVTIIFGYNKEDKKIPKVVFLREINTNSTNN